MIECNKINSDFVTIVTPNKFYCEPTLRVMNAGFNVVEDGVRGMQFIETMVRARYDKEQEWHKWVEKKRKNNTIVCISIKKQAFGLAIRIEFVNLKKLELIQYIF